MTTDIWIHILVRKPPRGGGGRGDTGRAEKFRFALFPHDFLQMHFFVTIITLRSIRILSFLFSFFFFIFSLPLFFKKKKERKKKEKKKEKMYNSSCIILYMDLGR